MGGVPLACMALAVPSLRIWPPGLGATSEVKKVKTNFSPFNKKWLKIKEERKKTDSLFIV